MQREEIALTAHAQRGGYGRNIAAARRRAIVAGDLEGHIQPAMLGFGHQRRRQLDRDMVRRELHFAVWPEQWLHQTQPG